MPGKNPCGHEEYIKYAVEMDPLGGRRGSWMKFIYVCETCQASWNDNLNVYLNPTERDPIKQLRRYAWADADAFVSARGDLEFFID